MFLNRAFSFTRRYANGRKEIAKEVREREVEGEEHQREEDQELDEENEDEKKPCEEEIGPENQVEADCLYVSEV